LRRSLTYLQAAEFLYETRLFPELEYTFKHALTYQVAYESLLQERRRELHTRIMEALEALTGERRSEQVERLAHHALRGEVWDKALTYFHQAGDKAAARSAPYRGHQPLNHRLRAPQGPPDAPHQIMQELALQTTLGPALMATKGFAAPEVAEAYARHGNSASGLGTPRNSFRCCMDCGGFMSTGQSSRPHGSWESNSSP